MDEKYLNKYRIPSNRLQGWDYSNKGIYFITICTANREYFFGNILQGEMQLNEIGKIANTLWTDIPKQFPFIELGKYVIMPNHIHGLLIVETQFIASVNAHIGPVNMCIASTKNNKDGMDCDGETGIGDSNIKSDLINCVSTRGGFAGNKNPLLNQNISRVVKWYKGRCSFEIRKLHADFSWQTRFYDHIVRDQQSLKNIEDYIEVNPLNWCDDELFL